MPPMEDEERILKAHGWYVEALKHNGRKHEAPENTDVRKTYEWRMIKNFLKKAEQYSLSDDMIKEVLFAAVSQAIARGALGRGGSTFLNDKKLIERCCNVIRMRRRQRESSMERMRRSRTFLIGELEQKHDLLGRKSPEAWPNVVYWYQGGKICCPFIALSKTCRKAVLKLQPEDRRMLPPPAVLNETMLSMLRDEETKKVCTEILGPDLLVPKGLIGECMKKASDE